MSAIAQTEPPHALAALREIIERHWGYRELKPLQEEAMLAMATHRDSLLVLPTGGGKSLCYQAPALLDDALTVVISPLISLMKDQVDDLVTAGVAAAQLNSSLSREAWDEVESAVLQHHLKLLFVSPERVMTPSFQRLLRQAGVAAFAIDEAHCISHWGHDFRPEYRQLAQLRQLFPDVSLHAYTATATEVVRQDIVRQLDLRDPLVLVGNFDRPNLSYRIVPRTAELRQVREVVERHRGEAGIVYCIRRADVDKLTAELRTTGIDAQGYHAGMSAEMRRNVQESFAKEECNLIVATVAFGMGIDRSNIRYVVHAAMPKSIEHYQQETGRAGRDGLEAECVLLHSGGDAPLWRAIMSKSPDLDPAQLAVMERHVGEMDRYCVTPLCRHAALVRYFGQQYDLPHCGACDICLGETEPMSDSLVVAQKILSCVVRLRESFGVEHVIAVLRGEQNEKTRRNAHEQLSTFGLFSQHDKTTVRNWIWQLVAQGFLRQEGAPYRVLRLSATGRRVLRGELVPRLVQRTAEAVHRESDAEIDAWEGVDLELFESLKLWRADAARRRAVPPFTVASDRTLREIAIRRPSSPEKLYEVSGIGREKLNEFGTDILKTVHEHALINGTTLDAPLPARRQRPAEPPAISLHPKKLLAFNLFRQGRSIDDVSRAVGRAASTVSDYLAEFVSVERPPSLAPWIDEVTYRRIAEAIDRIGGDRLKPIFIELGESCSYNDIRMVAAHRGQREAPP